MHQQYFQMILYAFLTVATVKKVVQHNKISSWEVRPLLKVERSPGIDKEANDIFELTVNRTELNNSRVLNGGGDWNGNPYESGYMETIRMSRTLEVLLGLNDLDNWNSNDKRGKQCFPIWTKELGIGLNCFSKETFFNPPLQKLKDITGIKDLEPCGFWGTLMRRYEIPFIFIKINQSYGDNDEYQGENLTKTKYNHKTG